MIRAVYPWVALIIAIGAAVVPVAIALTTAIPFENQQISQAAVYRIFFLHVPAAVTGTTAMMGALLVGAIGYLIRRKPAWERVVLVANQLGLAALSFALVSGMIWANSAWGTPWNWADPRLLMVAVIWFLLLAALILRAAIDEPRKRALFHAVFGLLIVVNVPLVKWSTEWFGTELHPSKGTADTGDGYGAVRSEFMLAMIAMNVVFLALLVARLGFQARAARRMTEGTDAAV